MADPNPKFEGAVERLRNLTLTPVAADSAVVSVTATAREVAILLTEAADSMARPTYSSGVWGDAMHAASTLLRAAAILDRLNHFIEKMANEDASVRADCPHQCAIGHPHDDPCLWKR